jgi:YD repeat-containing protein
MRRLPLLLLLAPAVGLSACATPPNTHLSVSPNPAAPGETVTGDATGSANLGSLATVNWDLNGDGVFDLFHVGLVERTSFSSPGQYPVSVMITNHAVTLGGDGDWASSTDTKVVTVRDPHTPIPSYTVSPNPACGSGTVQFDGSSSSDPDGSIVRYQWDLDGNGTFETDTGSNPHATRADYGATPAQRTTSLRVTDNSGRTATTSRALVIDNSICAPAASPSVSAAAVEHKARFTLTLGGRSTKRGILMVSGNRVITSHSRSKGTVHLRGLPTPLQRVRRARWVGELSSVLDLRTRRFRAQGVSLLDLGRRGHLCTSLSVTQRRARVASGQMKVLGGSGPARHIDGQATYTGGAGLTGPLKVKGHIEMEQKAKGKGLNRACRALLPKRRG